MDIAELYPQSIDPRVIDRACTLLRQGDLLAYPTDSNPALAADCLNPKAIDRLCRLKGIDPAKHTLTLVCSDIAQAAQYARIDNRAFQIIKQNTPGPFTFILPALPSLPKAFKGRKQVGVRIPDNAIARELPRQLDRPLLSGSLGQADPTDFENNIALVLIDATNDTDEEVQSTGLVSLLDSSDPQVLREGPIPLI